MLIRLLCLLLMIAAAALLPTLALGARLHDAGQIAFHSDADGDSDVYLLDVRTRALVNLTRSNPDYDSSPSWSPDGTQMAFASRRPERGDQAQLIYLMNIDGSGIERVTQLRSRKPSWSPDGLQIAFTSVADTIIVADL
ncbi:MAG: hypothetical protein SF123_10870, partial [Chloroflexota bacterium]|nr:hypothetical protein [Chloroflexota bacterium]